MTKPARLLILGGTMEALALARQTVEDPRLTVLSSLAGRTQAPKPLPGKTRVGGFGGIAGLTVFLQQQAIDLVVDATHPFAERVSQHAAVACAAAGVPRLVLLRPPWSPQDGDNWITVADGEQAAASLEDLGRRVFLSVGRQELAPYGRLTEHWFLIRMIDPPDQPLALPAHEVVIGRGPFEEAEERSLLQTHGIEALVSKNSGGSATYAKIAAARALGLPVVVIERPPPPPGEPVASVGEAVAWLEQQLS